MAVPPRPPAHRRTGTLVWRGLRRRCPVCGRRKGVFHRWFTMAEHCPQCGFRFRRESGHWLGSWFLNVVLAQIVAVGVLLIGFGVTYPDGELWPWAVADGIAIVAVSVWFFPRSRTLWCAIDLAMRPLTFDDGVLPGWELEAFDEPGR